MTAANVHIPGAPPRLDALTGIRSIAAWMVVFHHIRQSMELLIPEWLIAAMAKGYLAVDLFFMLSGFVLWYNYAGRLQGGGLAMAADFLWRRVARVWPLHIVVLGGFAGVVLVLAATGRSIAVYPLAELPLHVLLAQNWGFTPKLSWNHPAWSISTEMAAYLLFPLAVWAYRWDRLGDAALIGLAAALLAALYLLFALSGETTLGARITTLGLPRCLIEFALGSVLCILWQRWRHLRASAPAALVLSLGALAAGLTLRLPEIAFAPLVMAGLLMALACDSGPVARFMGRGAVLYLGEISYSTYLCHFLLYVLVKFAFFDSAMQFTWIGAGGYLAMVLISSIVLYHGVEKPCQAWLGRHKPRRIRMRASLAAK